MTLFEDFAEIAAGCRITVDEAHRRPIAIVGAGEIVQVAHLPAYTAAGLDVVGIHDLDGDRAREVAERFGIPRVYADVAEIAADDDVDVVDIAVLPWVQPDIARTLLRAGKHLLCQKALAHDLDEAQSVVDTAASEGRVLAVNQQLRSEEGISAAAAMVERGWIGSPTAMTFDVHIWTPWTGWRWTAEMPRLDLVQHSIHYLDAVRGVLGEPASVWGVQTRVPGQPEVGETRTVSVLRYPEDVLAVLHVFHKNLDGDPHATFRIDGTEGSVRGTLGLLYDYPDGRPDTMELFSRVLPTDGWVPYPVTARWIPDAFLGPMASVLRAIADGSEPPTSGRDHLKTLRLVDALYRSGATGDPQTP